MYSVEDSLIFLFSGTFRKRNTFFPSTMPAAKIYGCGSPTGRETEVCVKIQSWLYSSLCSYLQLAWILPFFISFHIRNTFYSSQRRPPSLLDNERRYIIRQVLQFRVIPIILVRVEIVVWTMPHGCPIQLCNDEMCLWTYSLRSLLFLSQGLSFLINLMRFLLSRDEFGSWSEMVFILQVWRKMCFNKKSSVDKVILV